MKVFHSQNIEEVEVGDILISEPLLPDSNFSRSVILICENRDDSHFGFILNKPLIDVRIQDMVVDYQGFDREAFLGGPVQQDHLQCIYTDSSINNSLELKDGFYWGGDFDEISQRIVTGENSINDFWFYLGYSGWGKGQLREELKVNSWLVSKHNLKEVFGFPSSQLWAKSLSDLGREFEMMSRFPVDARLN